jgi:C4-dicarboxylate-specific signal transduction histidine kinase
MVPHEPAGVDWPQRRRLLERSAWVVVLTAPLDLALASAWPHTLALRLAWALALVGCGWWLERAPSPARRRLNALTAALGSAFFLALLQLTGGSASTWLHLLPLVPVLAALMSYEGPQASLASGGVGALGMGLLQLGEGHSPGVALGWAVQVLVATGLALYGVSQWRRVLQAEALAREECARREALEKLAASELRRAHSERLATLGRLTAGVVHELNNPLAYLGSNLHFLSEELRAQPLASRAELEEVLGEMHTGLERLRQIAADLKGFSHMGELGPESCAVGEVVGEATRLASLRLKHVARLELELPEGLPRVRASRQRLVQVLLNLLVNAGEALEESCVQHGLVRVVGREEGERVVLLVEDNGKGFAPEVLPQLFEAFFTTKDPGRGTGLGLVLSREYVEQFGGTLTASNREQGGARLRLELLPCRLPLEEDATADLSLPAPRAQAHSAAEPFAQDTR